MSSLRSILGGSSKVKKRKTPSTLSRPSASSSSPWTSSLSRSKPGIGSSGGSEKQTATKSGGRARESEEDFFDDKLDDYGVVNALATDLGLRDTPQTIQLIRARMFSPLPETAAGMTSTRISEVLNFRRNLPPLVSVSHVQALLSLPSAVEREVAELARQGFLRRVDVPRRGAIGEFVVLASDYEALIRSARGMSDGAREGLLRFITENPGCQVLTPGSLEEADIRELVHAGFLTRHHTGGIVAYDVMSETSYSYTRPEDKITLTSLETVSRHAAGSLGTVGGDGAVRNVGGSGGGPLSSAGAYGADSATTEYRFAAPGCGSYLKLVSAALDYLVSLLGQTKYREAPETLLRERWDGGIAQLEHSRYAAAKRARGEFAGTLPGQTRKWRQFYGLSFDWVLREAVGAGLVEVFETRSVGLGVRVIR
ncbi:serine-threonine protein kinase 19-domain-containing protein [Xylariaceae sp. FL0594]|nr:serine-threonine protein kinase 19-domain-containing protein [Xylariaceae sp. FL0594]